MNSATSAVELRNTWTFPVAAGEIRSAAMLRSEYHQSRQEHHKAELSKVAADKPLGIDPPGGASGSGYRQEDEHQARMRHHRQRIDYHKGRYYHFMRWVGLMESDDPSKVYQLTYLDHEHFGLIVAGEEYAD